MANVVPLLSAARRKWEQGDAPEAERLWRMVLARDPGNVGAAKALGGVLIERVQCQEAFAVLGAAARRHPADGELRVLVARCLYGLGRVPEARELFIAVLERHPEMHQAKFGLAMCLTALHRAGEAIAMLVPLNSAKPNDPAIQYALGNAYMHVGREAEAVAFLRPAAEAVPSAGVLAELGWALYGLGRRDEAEAAFDRAAALHPTQPMMVAGKAALLIDRKESDRAREMLRGALAMYPASVQLLSALVRVVRTPEHRAEARAALERAIGLPVFAASKSGLFYALGGLQEADGDFDGAFESFRQANERVAPEFDRAMYENSARHNLEVFSRENLERLPRAKADPLPVFIVGMPRSGTSLVEQILASHPAVHGAGELTDLSMLATGMQGTLGMSARFPDCVSSLTQEQVDRLASAYLERLRGYGGGAERVSDKMPRNYALCGLIDMLLPGAKIIHCTRDPLDTCVSIYATALGQGHYYKHRFADLIMEYRGYRRAMDHWRRVLRVPILDVRYEAIVEDLEVQARRLVEFVGLPWDDRCLKFHENRRAVSTASVDQVRRPIYSASVGRWRRYEKHIGELIEGLREYL